MSNRRNRNLSTNNNSSYMDKNKGNISHIFNSPSSHSNSPIIKQHLPPKFQRRLILRHEAKKSEAPGCSEFGVLSEMIKKELVKPFDRSKELSEFYMKKNYSVNLDEVKDKWAFNYVKQSASPDKIPKMQQYKSYNFPLINKEGKEYYKNCFVENDNINIKPPKIKDGNKNKFLKMKQKFNSSVEMKEHCWQVKVAENSINNRSSVSYNIISQDENKVSGWRMPKALDVKVNNMKKGVSEYYDLSRLQAPNYSPKFAESLEKNKEQFRGFNGIFSNVYVSSHRNGNLIQPFKGGFFGKAHNLEKHKQFLKELRHKRSQSTLFNVPPVRKDAFEDITINP